MDTYNQLDMSLMDKWKASFNVVMRNIHLTGRLKDSYYQGILLCIKLPGELNSQAEVCLVSKE